MTYESEMKGIVKCKYCKGVLNAKRRNCSTQTHQSVKKTSQATINSNSSECCTDYSEMELISRNSSARCIVIHPQVHFLRTRKGNTVKQIDISESFQSNSRGTSNNIKWNTLGRELQKDFTCLLKLCHILEWLPLNFVLKEKSSRLIKSLSHILSCISFPCGIRENLPQFSAARQFSASEMLQKVLTKIFMYIRCVQARASFALLPDYFKLEIVKVKKKVREMMILVQHHSKKPSMNHNLETPLNHSKSHRKHSMTGVTSSCELSGSDSEVVIVGSESEVQSFDGNFKPMKAIKIHESVNSVDRVNDCKLPCAINLEGANEKRMSEDPMPIKTNASSDLCTRVTCIDVLDCSSVTQSITTASDADCILHSSKSTSSDTGQVTPITESFSSALVPFGSAPVSFSTIHSSWVQSQIASPTSTTVISITTSPTFTTSEGCITNTVQSSCLKLRSTIVSESSQTELVLSSFGKSFPTSSRNNCNTAAVSSSLYTSSDLSGTVTATVLSMCSPLAPSVIIPPISKFIFPLPSDTQRLLTRIAAFKTILDLNFSRVARTSLKMLNNFVLRPLAKPSFIASSNSVLQASASFPFGHISGSYSDTSSLLPISMPSSVSSTDEHLTSSSALVPYTASKQAVLVPSTVNFQASKESHCVPLMSVSADSTCTRDSSTQAAQKANSQATQLSLSVPSSCVSHTDVQNLSSILFSHKASKKVITSTALNVNQTASKSHCDSLTKVCAVSASTHELVTSAPQNVHFQASSESHCVPLMSVCAVSASTYEPATSTSQNVHSQATVLSESHCTPTSSMCGVSKHDNFIHGSKTGSSTKECQNPFNLPVVVSTTPSIEPSLFLEHEQSPLDIVNIPSKQIVPNVGANSTVSPVSQDSGSVKKTHPSLLPSLDAQPIILQASKQNGCVIIRWTFPIEIHHLVKQYVLFVRGTDLSKQQSWTRLGRVKPCPLPMTLTLTRVSNISNFKISVQALYSDGRVSKLSHQVEI